MEYLLVLWNHNFEDEPYRFFMELDENREQIRVVEEYSSGKVCTASLNEEHGTFLAKDKYPTIDELNSYDEFKGRVITREEFEKVWKSSIKFNRDNFKM